MKEGERKIFLYICKRDNNESLKQIISISFLLLANIILLAHAVVPHHHHNGVVVAIFDVRGTERNDHHHHDHGDHQHAQESKQATHQHQHNGNNFSELCALNDVYTRSDKVSKILNQNHCCYGPLLFVVLPANIDNFGLPDLVGLPFRQKPYINSNYLSFLTGSTGLRAPPVC